MAIHVGCSCGKHFALPDEWAGKRATCPQCRKQLLVTASSGVMPTGKSAPPPPPSVVPCVSCRQPLMVTPQLAGQLIACPTCKTQQKLPGHVAKQAAKPTPKAVLADVSFRPVTPNAPRPLDSRKHSSSHGKRHPAAEPSADRKRRPRETSEESANDGNRTLLLLAAIGGGGLIFVVGLLVLMLLAFRGRSPNAPPDVNEIVVAQFPDAKNLPPIVVPPAVAPPAGLVPVAMAPVVAPPVADPVAPNTPLNGKGIYDRALNSSVFINNSGIGFGSGAYVSAKNRLVVTNFHVVHRGNISGNERVIQTYNASLTQNDLRDKEKRQLKAYEMRFEAGKRYRIDMESAVIDSYLVVFDPTNKLVAFDDDSGGNLNARVRLIPTMTGTYRIHASTFAGGIGPFTLTIREDIGGPANAASVLKNDSLEVFFPVYEDRLVLERDRYLTLGKTNPAKYKAKILAADESKDLALVQLSQIPNNAVPLVLSKQSASPGERVHSIGNPGGSGALWVYTSGTARTAPYRKKWESTGFSGLMKHDALVIETQSPTNPGDSGGPLLNDQAELVGLTQGNLVTSNSISLFVDVEEIRRFLEANGFPPDRR